MTARNIYRRPIERNNTWGRVFHCSNDWDKHTQEKDSLHKISDIGTGNCVSRCLWRHEIDKWHAKFFLWENHVQICKMCASFYFFLHFISKIFFHFSAWCVNQQRTATYVAVILGHSCLFTFDWWRVVLRFPTGNNCCKFLESNAVNLQIFHYFSILNICYSFARKR